MARGNFVCAGHVLRDVTDSGRLRGAQTSLYCAHPRVTHAVAGLAYMAFALLQEGANATPGSVNRVDDYGRRGECGRLVI